MSDAIDELAIAFGATEETQLILATAARAAGVDGARARRGILLLEERIANHDPVLMAHLRSGLAVSASDLECKDTVEQLCLIASRIFALKSNFERGRSIADVFAGSGLELLPLLEQLSRFDLRVNGGAGTWRMLLGDASETRNALLGSPGAGNQICERGRATRNPILGPRVSDQDLTIYCLGIETSYDISTKLEWNAPRQADALLDLRDLRMLAHKLVVQAARASQFIVPERYDVARDLTRDRIELQHVLKLGATWAGPGMKSSDARALITAIDKAGHVCPACGHSGPVKEMGNHRNADCPFIPVLLVALEGDD